MKAAAIFAAAFALLPPSAALAHHATLPRRFLSEVAADVPIGGCLLPSSEVAIALRAMVPSPSRRDTRTLAGDKSRKAGRHHRYPFL